MHDIHNRIPISTSLDNRSTAAPDKKRLLYVSAWAVALGSGASGGTLAPLLTIGGAMGALLGAAFIFLFPHAGVAITMAVMVGMSAMFAGDSRALLTSVVFALETTGQFNALLPLLAARIGSYVISYLLMQNTIMTEKIARRGVAAPHEYAPDLLEQIKVKEVLKSGENIGRPDSDAVLKMIEKNNYRITVEDSLRNAVEVMAIQDVEQLPVFDHSGQDVEGILSYRDILAAYRMYFDEHDKSRIISLKRRTLKMIVRRKKNMQFNKSANSGDGV